MIKRAAVWVFFGLTCFLLGAFWNVPVRFALGWYFQTEYGEHVYKCDNAMREHFISKGKVSANPSGDTVKDLLSAEVALIDCHEYDKFRKKLLSFGLSEDDLARMGLVAIEEKQSDIQTLVQEHEIRF